MEGDHMTAIAPAYLNRADAAAYIGVSTRYFRRHVSVRPKELPGRGKRKVLVYAVRDLDAWVERVSSTNSRVGTTRKSA
jgi:hypothetical protein